MKVHIIYDATTGALVGAGYGAAGSPPVAPGPGQAALELAYEEPLPAPQTHRVDVGPPATLVAKTTQEMQDEQDVSDRDGLREAITTLELAQGQYASHGWAATAIDAKIVELQDLHDTLPPAP